MKPSNCTGCHLEKLGKGFTEVEVGARYGQTRLLIVGEASTENEARESLPFRPHGQAGSLLSAAMRECNISRSEVAITNIIRCRPVNDQLEGMWYQYGAINHCVTNYLIDVIKELKPTVILALGGTAMRALTVPIKGRSGTLDYIRGYALPGAGAAEGCVVVPTYHPAFIRRGMAHLTPLLQRDLRRAFWIATGKLIEGKHYVLDPLSMRGSYQTIPSVDEAWEWFRNIDPEKAIYADIETPRSRREDEDDRNSFADRDINLVQFTQRRGEGIAIPWRDDFISVAKAILSSPNRKVGHNWLGFDLPVLTANKVEINGVQDDTMLQFHYFHSDLPCNLQAATQFCGYPMAWKHLSDSEPEFYGCLDVDATCWIDETMAELLKRDGLWESYQKYFVEFHPILQDMSNRGYPISEPRRLELKEVIRVEDLRVDAAIKVLVPDEVLAQKQKYGYKNPPLLLCEGCNERFRTDHLCMPPVSEPMEGVEMLPIETVFYADLAEENGLVLREVIIKEEEKCRCSKKNRSGCNVCAGAGIIPAGLVEMRWTCLTEFNPNSPLQKKRYMKFMKHPIPKHAKRTDVGTGEASETTEVKELERLAVKTKDPIYPLWIEKCQLTKIDGTYADGWKPGKDGCIHTTFTMKPATWQLSSREPNIQNGIKHADPDKHPLKYRLAKAFNRMQAAKDGHLLVNFDFKSFHAQTLACEANDADYLRLAKIDVHSFVTCHFLRDAERNNLLPMSDVDLKGYFKERKKDKAFKFIRDFKAKRAILGLGFGMQARKLYQMNLEDFASEAEAKKLMNLIMEELFPKLKKYQTDIRALAAEQKFLQNKFGAIRRFYDVQRFDSRQQKWIGGDQAEASVAFLPASSAFGHVRNVLHSIRTRGWDSKFELVNTIHDSLVFDPTRDLLVECIENIQQEMSKPSTVLIYPIAPNGLSVEVEVSVGENLAEMVEWQPQLVG